MIGRIVFLAIILFAGVARGSAPPEANLQTPAGAMKTLLRAAQTGNARLWSACLSRTDRNTVPGAADSPERRRYEEYCRRPDIRADGPQCEGYEDYLLFQPVFSATGKDGIPAEVVAMAHILAENVWDDAYAEVTLILPFEVRGLTPPMTFCFLKEDGEWKLCQWLTTSILLGWNIGREPQTGAKIAILLKAHAGSDFNRRDCSHMTRKTFPVPAEVSAAYRTAVSVDPTRHKDGLLWLWALTGDAEALRLVAETEAADPKARASESLTKYAQTALGPNPCGPRPPETRVTLLDPESPEFYFSAAGQDIVALRALPERFPAERGWGAKAGLRAAEILASNEQQTEAVAEYLGVAERYPEQMESSVKARSQAAGLLWSELGRQAEAITLWKQLKTEGKLPADAVLDERRTVTPVTVLQDGETGYRRGLSDFDVLPDGNLLLLRLTERRAGRAPGTKARLDLHDNRGRFLRALPENGIEEPTDALFRSEAGLFLETHSKLIRLSAAGTVIGELLNWYDRFDVKPELHNGVYGTSAGERFPQAVAVADDWFSVLYWDSLRSFDYQGKLLRTVPVPFCDDWPNARGRMVTGSGGELVFTQPNRGRVLRVDPQGTLVPLRPPPLPPGEFGDLVHSFSDQHGNLYLIDRHSRRVLKFTGEGKYVRDWFDEGVTEPTSGTVDEAGNVYLVGYGSNGGETVTVFPHDAGPASTIRVPTDNLPEGNGNILDIEVAGDALFVVVGRTVAKADRAGRIVSSFRVPGAEHGGVTLTGDGKGSVFFPVGAAVWVYDGEKSHPVAEIPTRNAREVIGSLAVTENTFYTRIAADAVGVHDRCSGGTKQLKLPSGVFWGRLLAAAPDGTLYVALGDKPEVRRIAPDGGVTTVLVGSQAAKQRWVPADIALDSKGNVYVFDGANRSLLKFLPDGRFVAEVNFAKYYQGWLRRMRIDGSGGLYLLSDAGDKGTLTRFDLRELFPPGMPGRAGSP